MNASLEMTWDNEVVLLLVQAMMGLLPPELGGVSISTEDDVITLHVAVDAHTEDVQDMLEETVGNLEGFFWPKTPLITPDLYIGSARHGWPGSTHRVVFLRRLAEQELRDT